MRRHLPQIATLSILTAGVLASVLTATPADARGGDRCLPEVNQYLTDNGYPLDRVMLIDVVADRSGMEGRTSGYQATVRFEGIDGYLIVQMSRRCVSRTSFARGAVRDLS